MLVRLFQRLDENYSLFIFGRLFIYVVNDLLDRALNICSIFPIFSLLHILKRKHSIPKKVCEKESEIRIIHSIGRELDF